METPGVQRQEVELFPSSPELCLYDKPGMGMGIFFQNKTPSRVAGDTAFVGLIVCFFTIYLARNRRVTRMFRAACLLHTINQVDWALPGNPQRMRLACL